MRFLRVLATRSHFGISPKQQGRVFGIGAALLLFLLLALPVHAGVQDFVMQTLTNAFYALLTFFGKLTVVLFELMVQIAQYNDFLNSPAVEKGWVVVRDLANMFFILILLVIAFGTAFRVQQYMYNTLLRQVILMAVLINFSKLITGFFIDLMQVIMLTFVNAFADTAAGNLTSAVGLQKFLSLNPASSGGDEVNNLALLGTVLLGLAFLVILFFVVLAYCVMFLVRIVALWMLTVLSPLAYMLAAFPRTQQYASQWWQYFWRYATVGPVLAFFLWLSLTITAPRETGGQTSTLITSSASSTASAASGATFDAGTGKVTQFLSEVSSSEGILSFMLAIVLLVISLQMAAKSGAIGGALAAKVSNRVQRTGINLAESPFRISRRAAGLAAGATAATGGWMVKGLGRGAGRLLEGPARFTTGLLGAQRWMPGKDRFAALNTRLHKRAEERGERGKEQAETARDVRVMRRYLKEPGAVQRRIAKIISGGKKSDFDLNYARRKRMRRLAPALIQDPEELKAVLRDMPEEDFRAMKSIPMKFLVERFQTGDLAGENLVDVAPHLAAAAVRGKRTYRDAWGLGNYRYDAATRGVKDAANRHPGDPGFVMPTPDTSKINIDLLADLSAEKFATTRDMVDQAFNGDAAAFFASPEFQANKGYFLNEQQYAASLQQARMRETAIKEGRLHTDAVTVGSAVEKGKAGEQARVLLNFNDPRFARLGLDRMASGGSIENQQDKEQFADAFAAAYAEDQTGKRARELYESRATVEAFREQKIQEHAESLHHAQLQPGVTYTDAEQQRMRAQAFQSAKADQAFLATLPTVATLKPSGAGLQTQLNEMQEAVSRADPKKGLSLMQRISNPLEDSLGRARVLREVQNDAAFQQQVARQADDVRAALSNASSVALGDKQRVAEPIRRVFRHEDAHPEVNLLSDKSVQNVLGAYTPQQQQQILQRTRERWNNPRMSDAEAAREFLTEMRSTKGKSERFSDLGLDAQQTSLLMEHLGDEITKGRHTQARAQMGDVSIGDLRAVFDGFSPARRNELITQAREYARQHPAALGIKAGTRQQVTGVTEDDAIKIALTEILANHRSGARGGELSFTEHERGLALLLHQKARGAKPMPVRPPATAAAAPQPAPAATAGPAPARPVVPPPTPAAHAAPSAAAANRTRPGQPVQQRPVAVPMLASHPALTGFAPALQSAGGNVHQIEQTLSRMLDVMQREYREGKTADRTMLARVDQNTKVIKTMLTDPRRMSKKPEERQAYLEELQRRVVAPLAAEKPPQETTAEAA